MALSYNDFNLKFYNVINLYMCLIRNLSNNLLQYKQLHKALNRFKYIIPQCFDYEASPEVLKNYLKQIIFHTILSYRLLIQELQIFLHFYKIKYGGWSKS